MQRDQIAEKHLNNLISNYPDLRNCGNDILEAFHLMKNCFQNGNKLLVCGNGGSAADSEHIVGELMKGFMKERPLQKEVRDKFKNNFNDEGEELARHLQGALPAISLVSQSGLFTAFTNDVRPDMVFAQQVYGYGNPGDVLITLSTSGNSKNIINAAKTASVLGVQTISLSGETGGRMKDLSDIAICVPSDSTPYIQERHLPIYHVLCQAVEEVFFS